MRNLLLIFFCLIIKLSFGQIISKPVEIKVDTGLFKVDTSLAETYNSAYKKLPVKFQAESSKAQDYLIFTLYDVDTLNKGDTITKNSIDHDRKNLDGKDPTTYAPLIFYTALTKKALYLQTEDHTNSKFMAGEINSTFIHEINKKRIGIYFIEHLQNMGNAISPSVKILKFKINTLDFKYGGIIYGEAELLISSYTNYNSGFKTGIIEKKVHCKYIFKGTIGDGVREDDLPQVLPPALGE